MFGVTMPYEPWLDSAYSHLEFDLTPGVRDPISRFACPNATWDAECTVPSCLIPRLCHLSANIEVLLSNPDAGAAAFDGGLNSLAKAVHFIEVLACHVSSDVVGIVSE